MKLIPLLILLCGCTVPRGDIVSVTTTCYGAKFGYNAANQMPELYVGIIRQTAQIVPSNSPPVTSSLSLEQGWLTTKVFDEFTTGNASIPSNSVSKLRAVRAR